MKDGTTLGADPAPWSPAMRLDVVAAHAVESPDLAGYQPTARPIWLEALFPLDWLALHASPVYYGFGVPRGNGEPVVLVPGFLGSDRYLTEMHLWLRRIGYGVSTCGIWLDTSCSEQAMLRIERRVQELAGQHEGRVAIVGHSRGGYLAKALAARRPDQVSHVITLGSGAAKNTRVQTYGALPGYRAVFDFVPQGKGPVEMRCFLRRRDTALSETWSYRLVDVPEERKK